MELKEKAYRCDADGCLSTCRLAMPKDLEDPAKALRARGWGTADEKDQSFKCYCPAHKRQAT